MFRGPRFTLFAADELLSSTCEFQLTGSAASPTHPWLDTLSPAAGDQLSRAE